MKTIKYLSMAALALVGAMTVGCSSDDNFIEQTQQPVNSNNVVTLTATVGFDEAASNRALAIDYTNNKLTKTFEADDQIAVIYENTSGTMVKETVTIAAGDITAEGKSAKFTVTMTNPKASGTLKYIYPAAMAGATDVDYTKLASQDGTLASLASNLDLATFEGTLTAASELPASASLKNKLAILALTFKNSDGTSDLIGINKMALSDGTNSYSITGIDTDGHIYAAIKPTSGANIDYYATNGIHNYMKSVTSKTYAANNIYQQGLKMDPGTILSLVTNNVVARNGETITGTLGTNVQISIEDGATVTLKDVNINGSSGNYAGITCVGDATINLEGTNTVKGFTLNNPGIYVPDGKTLTIQGSGSLDATGRNMAAGIGGGYGASCGNIVINSGNITATGGANAAGIGGGFMNGTCGTITITSGVTSVKATAGSGAQSIGSGWNGQAISVTIGGTVYASGISTSPFEYSPIPATAHTLAASVVGDVVDTDGNAYTLDATHVLPSGVTAVGIVGKVTGTGHGLILALHDATAQTWNTINGWTSVTTYAGTTLKVLPDDAARGTNLTSYTTLGATAVSNWAVAQKSDYEAIFQNLGSTTGDSEGKTYDGNVNAYITTGVGGDAIDGNYWSSTEGGPGAWLVNVNLGDSNASATFGMIFTSSERKVLACLAF